MLSADKVSLAATAVATAHRAVEALNALNAPAEVQQEAADLRQRSVALYAMATHRLSMEELLDEALALYEQGQIDGMTPADAQPPF